MQAVNLWQDSFTYNNSAGKAPTGVVCKDDGSSSDHGLVASMTQLVAAGNNNAVMCSPSPFHQTMMPKPAIPFEYGWPGVALPGSTAAAIGSYAPPAAATAVCAAEALYDGSWPLPAPQGDDDGLAQSAQSSRTAPFVALPDCLDGSTAAAAAATSQPSAPGQSPRLSGALGPRPASASAADSSAPTPLACPDLPAPPGSGIQLADSSSTNHPSFLDRASTAAAAAGGAADTSTEAFPPQPHRPSLQPQQPHHHQLPEVDWPAARGRPTVAAIAPGLGVSSAVAAAGLSSSAPLRVQSVVDQRMRLAAAPSTIAGTEDAVAANAGTAAGFASRVWAPCRLASGRPHGQTGATGGGGGAAMCAPADLLRVPALRPECPFDWGLQLPRWEEGPGISLLSQAEFEERMALLNLEAWNPRPTRPITTPAASLGRWLSFIAATMTAGGDGVAAATAIQSAGYGPARIAAKLAVANAAAPAAAAPVSRHPSASGAAVVAPDCDGPLGPYAATVAVVAAEAVAAVGAAEQQLLGSTAAPPLSPPTPYPIAAAAAAAAAVTAVAAQHIDYQDPIDGGDQGAESRPVTESNFGEELCEKARRWSAGAAGSSEGGLLMATVARLAGGRTTEVWSGWAADGAAAAAAAAATGAAASDSAGGIGSRCDSEGASDVKGSGAESRDCTEGGGGGGEVGGCSTAAAGVKRRRGEDLRGGAPHPAQRTASFDPGLRRELLLSAIEEQLQLKPLPRQ